MGIDFGTTHSSAARLVDGRAQAIKDPVRPSTSVPTSIFLETGDELFFGFDAESRARDRPGRFVTELKRKLGQAGEIPIGDRSYRPHDLVAEMLRYIRRRVCAETGAELDHGVIAIPAGWNRYMQDEMRDAAVAAGFADIELLPEPVAAAIGHREQAGSAGAPETILVYDLGGGTFDVALVAFDDSGHRVLGYDGSPPERPLGGTGFDRAIARKLIAADPRLEAVIGETRSDDVRSRAEAVAVLFHVHERCRQIKVELSQPDRHSSAHVVPLPDGTQVRLELTRAELEDLTRADLDRTFDICRAFMEDHDWDAVDYVLLVGGSCRLPFIPARVVAEFDRPVRRADDPDVVVCLGAALSRRPAPPSVTVAVTAPAGREGQLRAAGRLAARTVALAEREQSPAIADALRAVARQRRPPVTVAVVGERSRGKSTLLNALLELPGSIPTDDDVTTNVYIVIATTEEGAREHVQVHFVDGRVERTALANLRAYASEAENPANREAVDHVEVLVSHPLLTEGLVFLDTPGVGGLIRAHDSKTMEAIRSADALLMILDASQPVTDEEIAFIARASDKARRVVFALNKADALGAEQNLPFNRTAIAEHAPQLASAPMLAVSARQAVKAVAHQIRRPERAARMRVESGVDDLVVALRANVLDPVRENRARSLLIHVCTALDDLERPLRAALDAHERHGDVAARMRAAEDEHQALLGQNPVAELTSKVEEIRSGALSALTGALVDGRVALEARVGTNFTPELRDRVAHECRQSVEGAYAKVFNDACDEIREAAGELWVRLSLGADELPDRGARILVTDLVDASFKEGAVARFLGSAAGWLRQQNILKSVSIWLSGLQRERRVDDERRAAQELVRSYFAASQTTAAAALDDEIGDLHAALRSRLSERAAAQRESLAQTLAALRGLGRQAELLADQRDAETAIEGLRAEHDVLVAALDEPARRDPSPPAPPRAIPGAPRPARARA